MKYTSAQANKLLKKLNDEYSALLDREQRSRTFRAAMGEDIESVRPAYDYAKTQVGNGTVGLFGRSLDATERVYSQNSKESR